MKYACLVYINPENASNLSDKDIEKIVSDCSEWVDELECTGKHVFSSGLQAPSTATTLRKRNGEVAVTDGPFAETKEFLGGFTLLEARDLNEAIMHGMKLAEICGGTVEVRPDMDPFAEMSDPMDKRLAAAIRHAMAEQQPA